MAQGRVILDSDWNESERIDDEDARRVHLDLIGARGTPNGGFRISGLSDASVTPPGAASSIDTLDFDIGAGSFYLGGLRFELGDASASPAETFLTQTDWLQIDGDGGAGLPVRPSAADLAGGPRYDLVYLRGWEQPVTPVEDSELLERALGGVDTSGRVRRMRRIEVLSGTADTCADAFAALVDSLRQPRTGDTSGTLHEFDTDSGELRSKARLTVSFDGSGATESPCTPSVIGGYLGADNQTLRVQLTAADRFIWGRDNATPVYRVQLESVDGDYVKVKFLSAPRDQAAQPLMGQAVEILRWGAYLYNEEKVAEPTGHLSKVASSYDPEEQTLTIETPVPPDWIDWIDAHSEYWSSRDDSDLQRYFYLRLWTGASEDSDPTHAFTPGTPVQLGETGLSVTFNEYGLPGEHWIVAARPHTPDVVVPWDLMSEARSAGLKYYFAPLARIEWSLDGTGQVTGAVTDCRRRFNPLTELGTCCTYTVGDGSESFGDYTSIQEAINALPSSGGKICVLPGEYAERVEIAGRENVTLEGCCRRSVVTSRGASGTGPVLRIVDSIGISVIALGIDADDEDTGILVDEGTAPVEDLLLSDVFIAAGPGAAIEARDGQFIEIRRCTVAMRDEAGASPGIYLRGSDMSVDESEVAVIPDDGSAGPSRGRGGIQLGGGSERVWLRDNVIDGGIGDGITLGSLEAVSSGGTLPIHGAVINAKDPCDPCAPASVIVTKPSGGAGTTTYQSAGALYSIRIEGNRIQGMGLNGIGIAGFFDLEEQDEIISVEGLEILGNRIIGCLWRSLEQIPADMEAYMGYGGVALAHAERLTVYDNVIADNGPDHLYPVCGVYVLLAEGADFSRNRISNNGQKTDQPSSRALPGARGGIWIGYAGVPSPIQGGDPGPVNQDPSLLRKPGSRREYSRSGGGGVALTERYSAEAIRMVSRVVAGAQGAKTQMEPSLGYLGDLGGLAERMGSLPAIRVHDNIVSSPLGRALRIIAIGPVSVQSNWLGTMGAHVETGSAGSLGVNVFILNAGVTVEMLSSSDQLQGLAMRLQSMFMKVARSEAGMLLSVEAARGRLDEMMGGNVLFRGNQCVLVQRESLHAVLTSSIELVSMDDVGCEGNQSNCQVWGADLLTDALVWAWSVRFVSNRLKETLGQARYSAVTMGSAHNMTTLNQSTHCFKTGGQQVVDSPNQHLFDLIHPTGLAGQSTCDFLQAQVGSLNAIANKYVQTIKP